MGHIGGVVTFTRNDNSRIAPEVVAGRHLVGKPGAARKGKTRIATQKIPVASCVLRSGIGPPRKHLPGPAVIDRDFEVAERSILARAKDPTRPPVGGAVQPAEILFQCARINAPTGVDPQPCADLLGVALVEPLNRHVARLELDHPDLQHPAGYFLRWQGHGYERIARILVNAGYGSLDFPRKGEGKRLAEIVRQHGIQCGLIESSRRTTDALWSPACHIVGLADQINAGQVDAEW